MREPTRPRRAAALEARHIADDAALSERVEELMAEDARCRQLASVISRRQSHLRDRVEDDAWDAYLRVEEAQIARWHRATLVVARWAFESGRGSRRKR